MEALEGLKIILDGSIGFALCAISLWLAKDFYQNQIKGEIHAARVAANSARDEAKKAAEDVSRMHDHFNGTFGRVLEEQSKNYNATLEVKVLSERADENVRKLGKLYSHLAQKILFQETEIKKINDDLFIVKNKKSGG